MAAKMPSAASAATAWLDGRVAATAPLAQRRAAVAAALAEADQSRAQWAARATELQAALAPAALEALGRTVADDGSRARDAAVAAVAGWQGQWAPWAERAADPMWADVRNLCTALRQREVRRGVAHSHTQAQGY
jgi:hypothetical protein